jgi:hypothetical protein
MIPLIQRRSPILEFVVEDLGLTVDLSRRHD